jgi:hypothetical protein
MLTTLLHSTLIPELLVTFLFLMCTVLYNSTLWYSPVWEYIFTRSSGFQAVSFTHLQVEKRQAKINYVASDCRTSVSITEKPDKGYQPYRIK